MKVAFDSQIFTMQEYGGISRYICGLATEIAHFADVESKILAPLHINAHLNKQPKAMVIGYRMPRIPKIGRVVHLASLCLARKAIATYAPHILHETYYSSQSIAPKGTRIVVTVHDMIHERFPGLFSSSDRTAQRKKAAVLRADHIICISENTRRNLLDLIPVAPEKVSIVYHGFDRLPSQPRLGERKIASGKPPYLLFVGSRDHYKNFNILMKAYASSTWLRDNFRLICVGGGAIRKDEYELMHTLGITACQVEQVSADDSLLADYYQSAAAFIYPSKYEGFGIPPLEAMALQCPVICSNTSSIPEVVGDAGEYFSPDDVDSTREAIVNVLQSRKKRDFLIEKGLERCATFSWEKCATETLAIYQSIL